MGVNLKMYFKEVLLGRGTSWKNILSPSQTLFRQRQKCLMNREQSGGMFYFPIQMLQGHPVEIQGQRLGQLKALLLFSLLLEKQFL